MKEKITAVDRMQRYIAEHLNEDISLDALAGAAGYSKYHAARLFKELCGETPFETIRAMRLTKAAQSLQSSDEKIAELALDSGFDSHDGFTRAFAKRFAITPQKYQRETPAVRWFVPYSILDYYQLKEGAEPMSKEQNSRTMTVTAVERTARKLILLRGLKATDYFSFCEEVGCDWEGILGSIPEKFDSPAILTLPPNLITQGTGSTSAGVEVPLDYDKPIPDGFDVVELPPCTMLYFQGAQFEDFCEAIDTLWDLMEGYDPKAFGWEYADELAPYFNFGTDDNVRAKMAKPVKKC